MFGKILIANRGEIACRVITTARNLGVRTVAIYSDADSNAKHVAMADEAVRIGPAPVAESYLKGDAIVQAALDTAAEAIHPGYGFLSENPDFVEAVQAAGLVFIGPPASAIRAMGLKDAAKALMAEAGVPVVPGYHGAEQKAGFLADEAEKIGYPVLIKARAGGGGKGMRLVEDPKDFKAALESAQREGQSSFGDPACLVEKYVTKPRHVEIQVFGDRHGNYVYLFERDCSLQRRHQKVIEEAPAPDMPDNVRRAMGEAALEAAKAVGYVGAGTVEFIADGEGGLSKDGFWFMEMNTRLQVEHPVSEAITGLDFVELQLRVAAGEPLPFLQEDLKIDGWAFEARVYAEDVPKGFLPATGTLEHLAFPEGTEFERGPVRVDSGVREGDAISPYYDPMIAKVIVHGPTRAAALNMLTAALEDTHVAGSVTNVEFLHALSRHEGFAAGEVDTGLIGRDLEALTKRKEPGALVEAVAALASLELLDPVEGRDPWETLTGWRHWSRGRQFARLERDGERIERQVVSTGDGFSVDGLELSVTSDAGGRLSVLSGGHRRSLSAVVHGGRVTVFIGGRAFGYDMLDALSLAEDAGEAGDAVAAPMPGLVKVVSARAGDAVANGDALLVLEAMKMEHTLAAPRDGVVAEVLVAAGDQVTDGTLLVTLEPEDG